MLCNKIKNISSPSSCLLTALCTGAILLSSGCTDVSTDSQTEANPSTPTDGVELVVVQDFADQVVIPTYKQLVVKADELNAAINALVSAPSEGALKAAQQAWIEARFPWEQSEAFAFGPADSLGYDGDLDDWPVNETDVKAVLDSGDELTPEYIEELQTTQKGFHTIEFLLFGSDNNKQIADFTEREWQFLQALATAFNQTANDLVTSWVEGIEGNPPYREVLATAGDSSNLAYPSVDAAVEEIVQGMIGCLDEVANEKIGEPLESKETEGLESRFSNSSLNDFKNNIYSVKHAYLGKFPDAGTQGSSVSTLIAEQNPELDAQVKSELDAAIAAVEAIPDPIEQKLGDEKALAKLETAKKEILTLFSTVEGKVLPLVQG